MPPGLSRGGSAKSATPPAPAPVASAAAASNQVSHDAHQHEHGSRKGSAVSTSSSESTRLRLITISDEKLLAMASDTKQMTQWNELLLSDRTGPRRWKMDHTKGDVAIYTRQEAQRFGVLSVGVVTGCVGEILNILQAKNSAQYAQKMENIFENQFKDAAFIHRVDLSDPRTSSTSASASNNQTEDASDAQLAELSVKTVTFQKNGWLSDHEEWCYLDAVYRHGASGTAEKLLTTIQPKTIVAGLSASRTKFFHDVTGGYLLHPEEDPDKKNPSNQEEHDQDEEEAESPPPRYKPAKTRVNFYSEFVATKPLGGFSIPTMGTAASDKTIKQRLLKLAENTSRLATLVTSQRLGLQVLVDSKTFFPPTHKPCMVCTKMLLVAKLCRLCGQGVCGDCSNKHERATLPRGRDTLRIENVRVCVPCLQRVDRAVYDHLSPTSLEGPQIFRDPENAVPATTLLKDLLQDALLKASSPTRQAGVMNVIKCVLDQETSKQEHDQAHEPGRASGSGSGSCRSMTPIVLTPTSSSHDFLMALNDLEVEHIRYDEAIFRTPDERTYAMDTTEPDTTLLLAPLGEEEDLRQEVVAKLDLPALCDSIELDILCRLAAEETGCSGSFVAFLDRETLHIVASNLEAFQRAQLPRGNSICGHTVLENKVHLIPHPEADIRFVQTAGCAMFGLGYYCAFPVVAGNDQVIGSFCVVNETSVEITESKFSAFKKLAETCNKVVHLHLEQRERSGSSSAASSNGSATKNE